VWEFPGWKIPKLTGGKLQQSTHCLVVTYCNYGGREHETASEQSLPDPHRQHCAYVIRPAIRKRSQPAIRVIGASRIKRGKNTEICNKTEATPKKTPKNLA